MYYIRGRMLTNKLLEMGFKLIRIDRDIKNRQYFKYAFKDSKELRDAITQYTLENKK